MATERRSKVVQVRVLAESRDLLEAAVRQLAEAGCTLSVPKSPGRKGDWLAYGTMRVASGQASTR